MPQKYPIVVLVGTSGGGKTALLLEMLKRFPGLCAPIKSKVTRARRNEQDGIFYDFLTEEEFSKLDSEGRLFQQVQFGGHRYGCDREQTDATVAHKLGLVVLVQQSIADFQQAGYKLHLVQIIPEGHHPRNEAERLRDDEERAKIVLDYSQTIVNSFAPGGFKKAADELARTVTQLSSQSLPNA
jgi:guanylate kinase